MNSPVTIDTQLLLTRFREAGYAVRFDPTDKVHRVRFPAGVLGGGLVGLVVVRLCPTDLEPRIMYAEFAGVLFPWWGRDRHSTEYGQSLAHLVELITAEAL